jgi:hypothetical protein
MVCHMAMWCLKKKVVYEAEWTVLLPDKALLIARCSSGKDSRHGAEFVGTICHRYCAMNVLFSVVLCSGFAGMHPPKNPCSTKMYSTC